MNRIGLLALIASLWLATALAEPAGSFPRPPGLEPDIQFWIRTYTEVGTNGGFIHDDRHLDVIYESVRFPEGSSSRTQRRQVKEAKKRYKKILLTLARGKREGLSEEQSRVLALWFQLGQSDKFRAGLIRSGAWEPYIRETLSEMGLPVELVALPHVESSYNSKARSHIGATGLWQFTRSTGRRYLRIDSSVDERMDPYTSTVAAARLLSHNRSVTGSWPLAITAYNHGAAGLRRAARRLGTRTSMSPFWPPWKSISMPRSTSVSWSARGRPRPTS
jgi:membrane-bound lytic murein transglycosylase D